MGTFRSPMSSDASLAAVLDAVDQDHRFSLLVDELAAGGCSSAIERLKEARRRTIGAAERASERKLM